MKALQEFLRPEFLSRVDEVVVFGNLTKDDFAKIAGLMLEEMREPLLEKNITLEYDEKALEKIAEGSYGGKYGARDIRRYIRKNIEDKVANIIIDSGVVGVGKVIITAEEELIVKGE